MNKLLLPLVGLVAFVSACQFHARGPDDYREATRAVLETRSEQIQSCYDGVLKSNSDAAGNVVVHFTVKEETGAIVGAEVLAESTAAPEVGECIVQALDGLALDPPDEREGDATFAWEFTKAG